MIRPAKEFSNLYRPDLRGCGMTPEGGFYTICVTEDDLVRGNLVEQGSTATRSVKKCVASSRVVFGTAYHAASAGSLVKIVVSGIAPILMAYGKYAPYQCSLMSSATPGEAEAGVITGVNPFFYAIEQHIGWNMEAHGAGTGVVTLGIITPARILTRETPYLISTAPGDDPEPDMSISHKFQYVLTLNKTLLNPLNPLYDLQLMMFQVTQGGAGGNTLAFDTKYRFSASLPSPVVTATVGRTDYFGFAYNLSADKWDFIACVQDFT